MVILIRAVKCWHWLLTLYFYIAHTLIYRLSKRKFAGLIPTCCKSFLCMNIIIYPFCYLTSYVLAVKTFIVTNTYLKSIYTKGIRAYIMTVKFEGNWRWRKLHINVVSCPRNPFSFISSSWLDPIMTFWQFIRDYITYTLTCGR